METKPNDEKEPPTEYGKRLLRAMKRAKMDRPTLVKAMGTSTQVISQVFTGETKKLGTKNNALAAQILGVAAVWLATGEGQDPDDQKVNDVALMGITLDADGIARHICAVVESLGISSSVVGGQDSLKRRITQEIARLTGQKQSAKIQLEGFTGDLNQPDAQAPEQKKAAT